jgi:aerobic carbon-monoxide dehydrogenase medium subunit
MIPQTFEYTAPKTLDEAVALAGNGAKLLAGGMSLIPMMKLRLAQPEVLVDINGLTELGYLRLDGAELRIGALTRHAELLASALAASHFPILTDAEKVIADPVVRNWGTVGGSLCQADPSEDLSAVCTTLDASCVIRGSAGDRVVTMAEFYRGPYETAIEDNQMLIEIRIPVRPGGSSAYEKVERRAGDWAVVSCGAAVWMAGGTITDARVGLAAVGPNTTGIPAISDALRGKTPSEELYERAGAIAAENCSPSTDMRGSVEYKRHLAKELTRRALRRSVARINGQAV